MKKPSQDTDLKHAKRVSKTICELINSHKLYKDKLNGESISVLAKNYSVSRPTVHRTIERMEQKNNK